MSVIIGAVSDNTRQKNTRLIPPICKVFKRAYNAASHSKKYEYIVGEITKTCQANFAKMPKKLKIFRFVYICWVDFCCFF
jgi:protein tyrosine phosphatase